MSSTARVSDRIALDDYPTPRWCVHRLLEAYEFAGGLWLEPCAGGGSIIRAVSEMRSDVRWVANEINPAYESALRSLPSVDQVLIGDACELETPQNTVVTITNPPFGPSLSILQRMHMHTFSKPVFLQRLNWAAGPRRMFFRQVKPSVCVLPDRPSFIDLYDEDTPEVLKAQTDSIEYAWFVFDGRGEFRILGDTPSEVRRAEIEEGRANGTRQKKPSKRKQAKVAA